MENNKLDCDEDLKMFFDSLKDFKSLTKEEERVLLQRYKYKNDIDARNKLITANLKYTVKLASNYRGKGISFTDLISEANDGLIESIDKYDLSNDVKLISYSKWWILQRVKLAIEKKSKSPQFEMINYNDDGDDDDNFSNLIYNKTSSDFVTQNYDTDNNIDREELLQYLDKLVNVLDEREKDMVFMYYGINNSDKYTFDEIGKKYGITKVRVRQIVETAFKKMRSEAVLTECKYIN